MSCARRPTATPRGWRASPCSATPRRRWARSPRPSAGGCSRRSTWPRRWTCRSSGSPCRPGRGSPWTRAARTSTGSPACCAASSSTPSDGGEVNVVVAGINVGAQPYWNAEATMLMHTRGILVMTPDSAMVLTGKQAIDYSGGVSAEDNLGIGGYGRVMGPNGEAQYWAPSLSAACDLLFAHYELTYRAPGERWPRRAATATRSTATSASEPHAVEGVDFTTVGDVFSDTANPDRKKPFDIRTVMRAVADRDHVTARAVAGDGRGGDGGRLRGPPRRPRRDADRDRVAAAAAARHDTRRRPARSGRRARCSRCRRRRSPGRSTRRAGAGRWSCSPTCPASTAHRSRCAGCSSSTAPRSAGRSSTSTGRSCCASSRATTAVPSSCSRRR